MTNSGENAVNPYEDDGLSPAYQDHSSVHATPPSLSVQQPAQQKQPDQPHQKAEQDESGEPSEQDIAHFIEIARKLEQELQSIVLGQERVIRELLLALLAGGHVLLEGVPGLGKTLLVRTLAETLALKFA